MYGVNASLHYFAMADDGQRIGDQGGIVPFSVVVNMPGRYTDAEEISTELDHGPSILSDLRQTGEYRGHPIYNGECITVTGRAEPPFVPLTMERYYKLMIADFRRDSTQNAARQRKDDAAAASRQPPRILRRAEPSGWPTCSRRTNSSRKWTRKAPSST